MHNIVRWPVWRQRTALLELHHEEFKNSSEFLALMEQFSVFHAEAIVARARKLDHEIETNDVVNMMFVQLHRKNSKGVRIATVAAAADNPWAYIGKSLQGWATGLWGTRGFQLEEAERIPAPGDFDDYEGPTFEEVVPVVTEILAERTPRKLKQQLERLVWFLAVNPPERLSYEKYERLAAVEYCPSFTMEQIAAVSNLIWGGRPKQSETSIMGPLLLDPQWDYRSSVTHVRALKHYEQLMQTLSAKDKVLGAWS